MKQNRFTYALALLVVLTTLTAWFGVGELAEILIKAERHNQPIPVLSIRYPKLDIDTAYEIQKAYIRKKLVNDKIAGFKAGLTSKDTQIKFGVEFPVAGVLLESGKKTDKAIIKSSDFKALMIETEIGFLVGKPIAHQIKDLSEIKDYIEAIIPVIELPELGFEDLKKIRAEDIIASNVGGKEFILGKKINYTKIDLNGIIVTLVQNGQIVNKGKGSDALGDQWKAVLWLVNQVVKEGWKIEPGQVLITGVLGKMLPGKQGKYIADYGNLGKIHFKIR